MNILTFESGIRGCFSKALVLCCDVTVDETRVLPPPLPSNGLVDASVLVGVSGNVAGGFSGSGYFRGGWGRFL